MDRHQATAPLERLPEGGLAVDPLSLGIDVREPDLDVLGPERHQAPAQHIQAALAGPAIIADHRKWVRRRYIPTRRDVRGRPMRRDRKDESDLADIGGQACAATHGESIAGPGRWPSSWTESSRLG